jgi:predicted DNA-binding transcriptional regulator AlpA
MTNMQQKIQHEPAILRRPQVEQRTGLSRSTLYQYIKDGDFPRPVRLGLRGVYLPMQKRPKISPSRSSVVNSPVISFSA